MRDRGHFPKSWDISLCLIRWFWLPFRPNKPQLMGATSNMQKGAGCKHHEDPEPLVWGILVQYYRNWWCKHEYILNPELYECASIFFFLWWRRITSFEQLEISSVNRKHSVLSGRLPDLFHFFWETCLWKASYLCGLGICFVWEACRSVNS